jgi:hypothetical protein
MLENVTILIFFLVTVILKLKSLAIKTLHTYCSLFTQKIVDKLGQIK